MNFLKSSVIVCAVALSFGGCGSNQKANEAAARAFLKYEMFPAQVSFGAHGFVDSDNNGIGEHGTIEQLLNENLIRPGMINKSGYTLKVILPETVSEKEMSWRATAAPEDSSWKSFSIDQTGEVVELP